MSEPRHRLPGFLAGLSNRQIGQRVRATGTWLSASASARREPEPEETDEDRAWRRFPAAEQPATPAGRYWLEIFEQQFQAENEAEPRELRASQEYLDAIVSRWTEANSEVLNEISSRDREAEE
jgi:hypothetical protein